MHQHFQNARGDELLNVACLRLPLVREKVFGAGFQWYLVNWELKSGQTGANVCWLAHTGER